MDTETLNEYLFANLVTQWAAQIARSRTASRGASTSQWDAEASVTADDLRAALTQLDMRRDVVRAIRVGPPMS